MKLHYYLWLLLLTGISAKAQIELHADDQHITVKAKTAHDNLIQFFKKGETTHKYQIDAAIFTTARTTVSKEIKKAADISYTTDNDKKLVTFTYNKQTVTLLLKDGHFSEKDNSTDISGVVAVYTPDGKQAVVEIGDKADKLVFYDGNVKTMRLEPIQTITINDAFFDGDKKIVKVGMYYYQKDSDNKRVTIYSDAAGTMTVMVLKLKDKVVSKYRKEEDQMIPLTLNTQITKENPCEGCVGSHYKVTYDFATNDVTYSKRTMIGKKGKETEAEVEGIFPKVGKRMEFIVSGFNPFKYDVTLTDEPKNFNTEVPALFTAAFTAATDISTISTKTKDTITISGEQEVFEYAMAQLRNQLEAKLYELKHARDCYNPCEDVKKIDTELLAYIKKVYPDFSGDFQSYLSAKMVALYDLETEDEGDKKKIEGFKATLKLYQELTTTTTGDYIYKIPVVKNVDQYVFKLNITPKTGVNAGARVLNQEIPVNILGGLKVDFSTGLYYTSLVNEKYTLVKDSLQLPPVDPNDPAEAPRYDKYKRIIRENSRDRDIGLSALMHVYTRMTNWINPALTLGAGATIDDKPRLQYLAGLSALFGKNGRLVLTYGVTMGYVEQLSERYEGMVKVDGDTKVSYFDKEVLTNKNFKVKPFISLTYNIPVFGNGKETVAAAPEAKEEAAAEGDKDKAAATEDSKDKDAKAASDKKALKKAIELLGK